MRIYNMSILIPRDHRVRSNFAFGKWWNIKTYESLLALMSEMSRRTNVDHRGRVLCIGRPGYSANDQERLFIVKFGHDNKLWRNVYTLGTEVMEYLKSKRK